MKEEIKGVVRIIREIALHLFWQPEPLGFRASEPMSFYEADWRRAFKFFLRGYAFEHQGRSPHFSRHAQEAVDAYKGEFPASDFAETIWKTFLDRGNFSANGKGASPKNNPLYHPSSSAHRSATDFVTCIGHYNHNIVKWASTLARAGRVGSACTELTRIRGVGPKISSLFIRDIVYACGIDEDTVGDKIYLQPVDIWTERAAESFAQSLSRKAPSRADQAQILVDVSELAGVPCALTNSGLWTLGSQLVKNADRFKKLLSNSSELREFLDGEARLLELRATAIRTVLGKASEE